MFWTIYVPMMSGRLMHSRDLDGLTEALTEPALLAPDAPQDPGKE